MMAMIARVHSVPLIVISSFGTMVKSRSLQQILPQPERPDLLFVPVITVLTVQEI